jgi:hypothetical protein
MVDPVGHADQLLLDRQATNIFFLRRVPCRDDNKEWGSTLEVKESRCGWPHTT